MTLGAVPASSQDDDISYTFHGAYMNAAGQEIENPSQGAIDAFLARSAVRARDVSFEPRSHTEYCADCLAAGVPEPPAFGSSRWKSKGAVAQQFTSQAVQDILVYESDSPPGVCVALPRGDGGTIDLLGVICQGTSGKACFWDNLTNTGDVAASRGTRIIGTDIDSLDLSEFRNGDQLHENCTNCHRGANVFLIHDELFKIPKRQTTSGWYRPIPSGPNVTGRIWGNPGRRRANDPQRLNLMRVEGCGQSACHSKFPSVGREYCGAVLKPSIERGEMPMGGFSEGDRDELVCRDFCLLHAECEKNGVAGVMQQARRLCDCDDRWPSMAGVAEASSD